MSELVGDAQHLSPSAQEALRLRAVAALVEGRTREDVAAVFKVSLKAVDGWWARWLSGGREAPTARRKGKAGGRAPGTVRPRAGGGPSGRSRSPAL
uniref:helix-turn-helix domain-containing protein n=1 Tax=Streptomyces luteireticuli TaxID=173858 RepID=UPI003FD7C800